MFTELRRNIFFSYTFLKSCYLFTLLNYKSYQFKGRNKREKEVSKNFPLSIYLWRKISLITENGIHHGQSFFLNISSTFSIPLFGWSFIIDYTCFCYSFAVIFTKIAFLWHFYCQSWGWHVIYIFSWYYFGVLWVFFFFTKHAFFLFANLWSYLSGNTWMCVNMLHNFVSSSSFCFKNCNISKLSTGQCAMWGNH